MDTSASIDEDQMAQFAAGLSRVNRQVAHDASCQELAKDTPKNKTFVIGVRFYQDGGNLSKKIYPYRSRRLFNPGSHVAVMVSGMRKVVRVMVGKDDQITKEFQEKAVRFISTIGPTASEIADTQYKHDWNK